MHTRTLLVILALAGLLGGCAKAGSGAAGTTSTPQPVVYLLGEPEAVRTGDRLVTDFETRTDGTPGEHDIVLFTVAVVDGPMPQTREHIEALRGKAIGPAAILLVKTDQLDDDEIKELVIAETRDLLLDNKIPNAKDMPVLVGEDPNFELTLRGLTERT